MNIKKESVNIVWLKRNLRLEDNEAIHKAFQHKIPVLLLYVFEPSLQRDPHYSKRHWDFIKQSIEAMNCQLVPYQTKVVTAQAEIIQTIATLQQFWKIETIFSHYETGIRITYERDKAFSRFCKNNLITWEENTNNGVFRGRQNRLDWVKDWEEYMSSPLLPFTPKASDFILLEKITVLEQSLHLENLKTPISENFQRGGTDTGEKYLSSFLKNVIKIIMRIFQNHYWRVKPVVGFHPT